MHSLPSIRLSGLPKDGARTNKRSVSVFVRAKGKSRRCAATEAPTDVAFVAAADLSSDEFLKGIYNVATSSRLFTEKAFPQVATRLSSHRTIPILVYRTLPLSFRASIVGLDCRNPSWFAR